MKIRILINEQLINRDELLKVCKTNKFLKLNQKNILYFNWNNWEKAFAQISQEMLVEKKYDRLVVFAENDFLPFFYFSKIIGFVAAAPFDIRRAQLCREHNNANVLVITKRVPKEDMDSIINAFFQTEFEGGRHITRFNLMQVPYKNTNITYKFSETAKKTVVMASDHAGFAFKEKAKHYLEGKGYKVIDVGTDSLDSTHYPLYAIALVKNANKACCGLVFCSTGIGMANTINNFKGLTCLLGTLPGQAKEARSTFGANVLSLGARYTSWDVCRQAIDEFVTTEPHCDPRFAALSNYGVDLDMDKFRQIKLEGNIKLPKELQ